jgi:hypothetical protein
MTRRKGMKAACVLSTSPQMTSGNQFNEGFQMQRAGQMAVAIGNGYYL